MSEEKEKFIVVLVTASSLKEGKEIAKALLEKRQAACVNLVKNISSFFVWKGKIQAEDEVLLIIKSKRQIFDKMMKTIKSQHSYEVPEIIAFPIIAGDTAYLKWLDEIVFL